jgi:hypothetical protein
MVHDGGPRSGGSYIRNRPSHQHLRLSFDSPIISIHDVQIEIHHSSSTSTSRSLFCRTQACMESTSSRYTRAYPCSLPVTPFSATCIHRSGSRADEKVDGRWACAGLGKLRYDGQRVVDEPTSSVSYSDSTYRVCVWGCLVAVRVRIFFSLSVFAHSFGLITVCIRG